MYLGPPNKSSDKQENTKQLIQIHLKLVIIKVKNMIWELIMLEKQKILTLF